MTTNKNEQYKLIDIMKKIIKKFLNPETISYLFFGVLTTLVNYVSYFILSSQLKIDYKISTVISWTLAVLFAYITNKIWVFKSTSFNTEILFKEIIAFLSARIVSGIFEFIWMIFTVEVLKMNDLIAKLLANVFVVIMNYFFSKIFIFKKSKH